MNIYSIIKRVAVIATLFGIISACTDESIIKQDDYNAFATDGSLAFSISVPDYALPTRATGDSEDIDTTITTLHLYLFDERGGFIGIVEADKADNAPALDPGEKDQIINSGTNATGQYKASIPQNTDIIHFVANAPDDYKPGKFDLNRYKGLREEEVFLPMTTTEHVYWGTSTYSNLTTSPNPVVLYRNYAKVKYRLEQQTTTTTNTDYIHAINGWTLCNGSQNSLIAPYDDRVATQHFHFNLTDNTSAAATHRYVSVPTSDQRVKLSAAVPLSETDTSDADQQTVYTDNQGKALPLFDHTTAAYSSEKYFNSTSDARVFAIFHITTGNYDGSTTTFQHKFYKILFLKEDADGGHSNLDIKRNHIYTICFEGINPELGYNTFDEAVNGNPANISEISVEESLPEVQSTQATLRVVNGTVRYIDDLTTHTGYTVTTDDAGTRYSVNDLRIYYSGADAVAEGEISQALRVEWVDGQYSWTGSNTKDTYRPEQSSLVCKKTTDPSGTYTHTISFDADAFAYGDNGEKHYKEGLIRVIERLNGEVLSRFVRVYIGNPISFRPLLISSDIPAMADERITVAFSVPDSFYLPTSLYPIEVRFGSDQVDVEKNLYTESMKVDLVSTAYEDNLLQYTNVVDGVTLDQWGWYANGEADDSWKDWGYKYTYTIEEPADSGEHRITLRTVYDGGSDFSVVMEGLSTVLFNGTGSASEADIFNTRELRFNVLNETTLTTARRIMLDNGLYDTRLTTAYVNINKSDNASTVSIPYTLGYFNPEDETDCMTPATLSTGVNLWVYYRPDDLTPSGTWATLDNGVPFVDAEGNHFAKINNTTSATGTLTFTLNSQEEVKNSLVFITARSGKDDNTGKHPYGSDYTGKALGEPSHVYTGVNAEDNAWRSASALVSVLSDWKFNPAPTEINDNSFEYASEFERNYGVGIYKTDYDFLVRIDRPTGTSGIKLSINTGGNLQLIEQVGVSKYTLETGYYELVTETWNEVSTPVHRSKADANGDIHLTLTGDQSPYCVLRFRPLHYDHSGTITFEDISTTAIYNNGADNTLKITHSPLTIIDHKYMWRDDYMLIGDKSTPPDDIAETMVADANFYENFRVDANTAGQEFVARLYFPNSVKERMSDKDEKDQELTFSFLFAGIGAKVIEPTDARDSYSNHYTVDEETGMVTVTKLISGNGTGTDPNISYNGVNTSQAFVDIFLRTNEDVSTENFRITSGDDLLFYRYTLGEFSTRTESANGGGKVIYEISNDNTNWMTIAGGTDYFNTSNSILSSIYDDGQPFYLRVTLKNYVNKTWNPTAAKDQRTDLTLKTSGFKVIEEYPTGSTYTRTPDDKNTNGTVRHDQYRVYTYRLNNAQWAGVSDATNGTGRSIVVKLQTESTGLAEYLQLETRTDMSDEKTDWGAILDRTTILMGTQTTTANPEEWELWFANGRNVNSNKAGNNNLIFDVNAQVNEKQTTTSEDYYPIKLNNELNISFYAPFDGLDITVGVSQREGYADRNYAIYQVTPTGETALHSNITSGTTLAEHTYTLGKAGLYRLRGTGSGDFYLYYIKLKKVKQPGQLGTTSWTAKRLDNSTKANATWSGSFNDDAENITLSAFAEKLTLTFANIQEEPFTMRLLGDDFRFLTPEGNVTELKGLTKSDILTIVPTNGGVLKHGDVIQLDGESSSYFYTRNIGLKLRPYVTLTSNLNFETFESIDITESSGKILKYAKLHVGDELTFTFTYMDNSIETDNVQFGLGEFGENNNLTATAPTGWTKGNLYTLNNPKAGDGQTFILKATTATTGTLAVACGTADYDVYAGDTLTGSFFNTKAFENIYPKIYISGASITYSMGGVTGVEGELPADVFIKESDMTDGSYSYTLPKNYTLYKEGWTLTGWSDGTNTYNPGATLSVSSNVTLTPVFTENTVSLNDRTEKVTITWDFQRNNGAPIVEWQYTDGHVWVAQATVTNGSTTERIDVKMDVNTTGGKFNNSANKDCTQINGGTIFTIPSCSGASVEMECHSLYTISTTTIDGSTDYDSGSGTTKITETVTNTADNIEIVIGDGSFYKYLTVTLPVVANQYTVTYYNEGYTTSDATYTQFEQQMYGNGDVIVLPGSYPSGATHWATCSKTTSYGYSVEQKTQIKGGESVNADMHIYPVWPVTVSTTSATVSAEHVYHAEGCYTRKEKKQLIESSSEGDYILFDIVPNESGTYMFTAPIGTTNADMKVTLGYVNANGEYQASEQLSITNNGNWNSGNNYSWIFNLTAGTTYIFKMTCDTGSNTCVNVFDMTVEKITTDVYELYDADGQGDELMTVFKNGVSTDETVIVTTGFSSGAIAGSSHRTGSVSVNLFDSNTGMFSAEQTELVNGSKLGGSQYVTLDIKYPSKMMIVWGQKSVNCSIKINDEVLSPSTVANEVYISTVDNLQPGTYVIQRSGGEGRLWYLRLSPTE
ncbi:MAG: hypothetical protein IKK62_11140 [Bacteroidaceae bacterium]|nr:hypothetical protein [Bacteroidaceae bacterium]